MKPLTISKGNSLVGKNVTLRLLGGSINPDIILENVVITGFMSKWDYAKTVTKGFETNQQDHFESYMTEKQKDDTKNSFLFTTNIPDYPFIWSDNDSEHGVYFLEEGDIPYDKFQNYVAFIRDGNESIREITWNAEADGYLVTKNNNQTIFQKQNIEIIYNNDRHKFTKF